MATLLNTVVREDYLERPYVRPAIGIAVVLETERAMSGNRKKGWSQRDIESSFWIFFEDLVRDGDLASFFKHAGITIEADCEWDNFKRRFTSRGRLDLDLFLDTVVSWPPIAARVAELKAEKLCRDQRSGP
ncbi:MULTISPECIES: hypothetical protein [Bradyrhizobium]|uniref:hypothetical protein n=1 Tax=Bradyrhizobium TaxID=374 RepID=UPI0011420AEB|nr:hypothetical protein [Bradyrhizobium japonicum]MCS3535537.1 hypothetical protein [Bradyrhizobium japonicum]MCS3988363.1 hypothetical protein [Bradyrhizobium japonicum]MCS4016820.1 hypothetical protein [Bradyrhizobium japonicum]MCS4203914.1 hypothetical protein [Bradyrhizobium japonicum]MDH6174367.1 hypothetical protein [Bradyrhizobium japonicum]